LLKEKNREQHYVRVTGSTQQSDQVGCASHDGGYKAGFLNQSRF